MCTIGARSRETEIPMNEDIPIKGENTLMLILSKTTPTYLIYAITLLDLALFERLRNYYILFTSDIEMITRIRNLRHLRRVRRPMRKAW